MRNVSNWKRGKEKSIGREHWDTTDDEKKELEEI